MSKIIISSLTETAIKIQKDLKMLPYAVLLPELQRHGFNLMPGIQNKHTIYEYQRKQGIAKPYAVGADVADAAPGKVSERTLTVEPAYASVTDNIKNYKAQVIGPGDSLGINKSKKHPWQVTVLMAMVRTFGEDILDAIFHAERNTSVLTPLGMFNGIDYLIDADITAENISVANGNYVATDAIEAPSSESDYDALTILLDFWRSADQKLRRANSRLLVPIEIGDFYDDAYFNKHRYKPERDAFGNSILAGTGGKCTIVRSEFMGTGTRLMLTVPGNIDFGMNTQADEEFVQVRSVQEDPNEVQFWIQGDYGLRVRSVHKKMFQVNDGTPVGNQLSGDYS